MKKIECPNCASASFKSIGWDKYICEYCGTVVVEEDGNFLRLEVVNKPIAEYCARVVIPREMMYMQGAEEYAIKELARGFITPIIENMELNKNYNPARMEYEYRARVQIVRNGASYEVQ